MDTVYIGTNVQYGSLWAWKLNVYKKKLVFIKIDVPFGSNRLKILQIHKCLKIWVTSLAWNYSYT